MPGKAYNRQKQSNPVRLLFDGSSPLSFFGAKLFITIPRVDDSYSAKDFGKSNVQCAPQRSYASSVCPFLSRLLLCQRAMLSKWESSFAKERLH